MTRHHLTPPSAHGVILMVATRNLERANSERAGMMTANEAADQLGVKLGTLYAYVSRGWLKSYRRKVGRQALYRRPDIEALRGVVSNERGRRGRSRRIAPSRTGDSRRWLRFQDVARSS